MWENVHRLATELHEDAIAQAVNAEWEQLWLGVGPKMIFFFIFLWDEMWFDQFLALACFKLADVGAAEWPCLMELYSFIQLNI